MISITEEFTLDFDDDGIDDDDSPEGVQPVESLVLERYALDRYRLSLHELLAITRNPEGLVKALKDQRNARRFDKLHLGSMVARFKGHPSLALRNLEIQALNEFKQFDEARALALDVIKTSEPEIDKNPEARQAWIDAHGHLGRTCKQQYVDWAKDNPNQPLGEAQHKHLLEAMSAYGAPFRRFGEACLWHGINVVALLARGREDGVPLPATPDHAALATEIIASVDARAAKLVQLSKAGAKLDDAQKSDKAYLEGERAWDIATSAEAHVAIGKFGKARRLYAEFLTASTATARETKSFEAFSLESAFRQLDEVWRLGSKKSSPQAKGLLTSVKLAMARAPGTQVTFNREEAAHLVANPLESASDDLLEAQSSAFEAVHDGYSVLPAVTWHERFREVMCAIARIDLNRRGVDGKRPPRGSGFLIDGGELRDSWKGLTLFITNAHVVYPEPDKFGGQVRPIKPESAIVTFTVAEPDNEYRIKRVLWQSRHHDVVICELDRATAIKPLTGIELDLPAADEAFEITVVGHPGGREMSFAPSNLKLHRHDGPDAEKSGRPVLLHYRASTEPGNSGSPAFNWRTMRLIGVHHAGRGSVLEYRSSQGKVQRIDRGAADINEAIAICSIRQALGRAK